MKFKGALIAFATCAAVSVASARGYVVGIADVCRTNGLSGVKPDYPAAVHASGATPCVLPCTTNAEAIAALLDCVDMLLLAGGEDVEPSRYGEKRDAKLGRINLRRDAWEFALVAEARKRRLPILGVCRGCQVLNVAFGGTLWQDIPSQKPGAAIHRLNGVEHAITVEKGSYLASLAGESCQVNTYHHQAVKDLAKGFRVTAMSPDGVVEAIEGTDYPAVGVQFHPEKMLADWGRREFLPLFRGAFAKGVAKAACPAVLCVSPDGRNAISFEGGERPHWTVTRDGRPVTGACDFGLRFGRHAAFGALEAVSVTTQAIDSVWHNRLGDNWEVRDRANETTVVFAEREGRKIGIVMRAYDEGVAFRYLIPEQEAFGNFTVTEELTTFRFHGDPLAWYAAYDTQESSEEGEFLRRSIRSLGPGMFAQLPAVVETPAGFAAICEADLTHWAGASLVVDDEQRPADSTAFKVALARAPVTAFGAPAGGIAPGKSPWRVLILADDELDLIRHKSIVLNLNPPPEGGDAAFDWVKPGASAWDWWYDSNNDLSTTGTLEKIDFAAEMGWPYHTMDAAWYGRPAGAPGLAFEPRADLDLKRILAHAKEKGVGIFLWVHWALLEERGVEETFAKFERWGVKGVKIDFLARKDQLMVEWCEKVCRVAAKHRLLVNFHAMYHPTGMRRTWPNQITREGVRGNEITKWQIPSDALNPATLVFTRFLVGPGDYTPGGVANVHARDFTCQMDRGHRYGDSSPESVAMKVYAEEVGTRAHALALCVALDSPLMTLCDCPARYRAAAGAELLKDLPTAWKRTVPLAGRIGRYYAVAREAFDGRIYLAVQTAEARTLRVKLDFLGEGRYAYRGVTDDPERTAKDANVVRTLRDGRADARMEIELDLADEGGALLVFKKAE